MAKQQKEKEVKKGRPFYNPVVHFAYGVVIGGILMVAELPAPMKIATLLFVSSVIVFQAEYFGTEKDD